jgi:Tol biopolymer transport system component
LFVTSLFGSRQAAVLPVDGGYPLQLTAEREGVIAARYSPTDPRQIVAIVRRDGRRRVVLLDDQGSPPLELEKSPGDQLFGGFTRDGKRVFFASFAEGKARLFQFQLDGNKATEVLPGTTGPASGVIPPPYTPPPPRDAGVADAGTGVDAGTAADAGTGVDAGTGAGTGVDAGTGAGPRSNGGAPAISSLADVLPDATALGPPSPDARFLLLVTTRGGGNDVYSIELSSTRATLLTPHEGKARFADPRWSPDGRTVYVLTDAGRDRDGVDAVTVATRERKTIYAPPNRRIEAYALTESGHRLAAAEDASGRPSSAFSSFQRFARNRYRSRPVERSPRRRRARPP